MFTYPYKHAGYGIPMGEGYALLDWCSSQLFQKSELIETAKLYI
jgi:hypothetical protein